MSSLTLEGATGALVGWARNAEADENHHIAFIPSRRFVIYGTVEIDEQQLRQWFDRFLQCWPTKEQIDAGHSLPTNEKRRELNRRLPDVGFQLTGNVDRDAGFVISWEGGWIRGNANAFLLAVHFDGDDERARDLRLEIESLLQNTSSKANKMG